MLVNSRCNWGKSLIVQTSFGLKRSLPKLSNLLLLFIFISVALAPLRALAEPCEQWVAKAGAQLPAWDEIKKELLGSADKFDKLQEAANTFNGYYVHDVS